MKIEREREKERAGNIPRVELLIIYTVSREVLVDVI